jgi:hydroxypyruvate isomerase
MPSNFITMNHSRRHFLQSSLTGAAVAAIGLPAIGTARAEDKPGTSGPGRIKQTVSMGAPKDMPFEKYAQECARLGYKGFDLVGPDKFEVLKKFGLVATMIPSHGLTKGLNHTANHAECLAKIRSSIEAASANGYPNVICFSGNRDGISDEEGAKNCVEALKQVAALAEEKKVTLCMELLNSKVNHKDYQCDHTEWGVSVMKAVGSPRCKLLYDIYHMQIMEGDVIATLTQHINYIGHFHTAGVPGRKDIDDTQELYYPAIMRAIAATGYQGYVGQEFGPKGDKMEALAKAYKICDV